MGLQQKHEKKDGGVGDAQGSACFRLGFVLGPWAEKSETAREREKKKMNVIITLGASHLQRDSVKTSVVTSDVGMSREGVG